MDIKRAKACITLVCVTAAIGGCIASGGEGGVKRPFKINGHPYSITSGRAIHDIVFTVAQVDPDHLRPGMNEITLLSDTEHHGIEVLLPGPVVIARCKQKTIEVRSSE